MADTKITALAAITTVDPAADVLPIVDVSDTSMAASGTTKKITSNQILGAGGTATLASATITGDLTVATDRLKVNTGSTAVQIGATTQTQFGTTAWPSDLISKANSRVLIGNLGTTLLWNESSPAIGNASTLYIGAKTGAGATTFGGGYISAGTENASDRSGFLAVSTFQSNGIDRERYRIDSTGVHTWQYVGGVAGTAMTLNSTGLGVGASPTAKISCAGYSSANQLPDINITRSSSGTAIQTGPNIVFTDGTSNNTVTIQNSQGRFGIWNYGAGAWNERLSVDAAGNCGIAGSALATGIDTGVTRLFVVAPNSNTGMAATFIADSVGRGLLVADQGKTNSFGVEIVAGLVKTGAFTSGTSVALFANAVERARIKSTGQVRFVPLASDPAGAEAGDVYYNSTSNKLKCYNGTTWNDLF